MAFAGGGITVDGITVDGIAGDGLAGGGLADDGIVAFGLAGDGITVDGITVDGITDDGITDDGITDDGITDDGIAGDGLAGDGLAGSGGRHCRRWRSGRPPAPTGGTPDSSVNPTLRAEPAAWGLATLPTVRARDERFFPTRTPLAPIKQLPLHINTVSAYWSTFRHCLHEAYREKKIKENPNGFLERNDTIPTEKEHLSQPELIRLAETDCDVPVLKKAFLFACLTGLRKSDIKQLTWEDIQPYSDGGMYVTLRMQKTKDIVPNPISDEALELIG